MQKTSRRMNVLCLWTKFLILCIVTSPWLFTYVPQRTACSVFDTRHKALDTHTSWYYYTPEFVQDSMFNASSQPKSASYFNFCHSNQIKREKLDVKIELNEVNVTRLMLYKFIRYFQSNCSIYIYLLFGSQLVEPKALVHTDETMYLGLCYVMNAVKNHDVLHKLTHLPR